MLFQTRDIPILTTYPHNKPRPIQRWELLLQYKYLYRQKLLSLTHLDIGHTQSMGQAQNIDKSDIQCDDPGTPDTPLIHQHLLTFKLLITDNILVTHRSVSVGKSSDIKQTRCCDDSGHRDGFVMMDQRKSVCLDNCLFIYI